MNYELNFSPAFKSALAVKEIVTHGFYEGARYAFHFPHGLGASVVKNYWSRGGADDFWEVALLKQNRLDEWDICYDSAVTLHDVIGCQTDEEVDLILRKIAALDSAWGIFQKIDGILCSIRE